MAISWTDAASLATAGGTLVLALATFSSVRSANRAARAAERSLLAGLRPVLIPSREDDPVEQVRFGDGVVLNVAGHGAALELHNDNIYFGLGLRNGGAGLAVIHGWQAEVRERTATDAPDFDDFRRQLRDLFIPARDVGFWQGATRDRDDPSYRRLSEAATERKRIMVDLLYGDYEGGQLTVARVGFSPSDDNTLRAEVLRYWNVDGADPRQRA